MIIKQPNQDPVELHSLSWLQRRKKRLELKSKVQKFKFEYRKLENSRNKEPMWVCDSKLVKILHCPGLILNRKVLQQVIITVQKVKYQWQLDDRQKRREETGKSSNGSLASRKYMNWILNVDFKNYQWSTFKNQRPDNLVFGWVWFLVCSVCLAWGCKQHQTRSKPLYS